MLFERTDGDEILRRSGITRARRDESWQYRRHEIGKADRLLFAHRSADFQAHKSRKVGLDWQPWPESDKPSSARTIVPAIKKRVRPIATHATRRVCAVERQLEETLTKPTTWPRCFARRQRTSATTTRSWAPCKLPLTALISVVIPERRVRTVLGRCVALLDAGAIPRGAGGTSPEPKRSTGHVVPRRKTPWRHDTPRRHPNEPSARESRASRGLGARSMRRTRQRRRRPDSARRPADWRHAAPLTHRDIDGGAVFDLRL